MKVSSFLYKITISLSSSKILAPIFCPPMCGASIDAFADIANHADFLFILCDHNTNINA